MSIAYFVYVLIIKKTNSHLPVLMYISVILLLEEQEGYLHDFGRAEKIPAGYRW